MKNTKSALLVTLFACMSEKTYTKACVDKQLNLLQGRHGIKIKRRWLFQCLKDLVDEGLITRGVRFKNESDGRIHQLSSMFAFTIKGARHLIANRVEGSILLLKKILAWAAGKDKRFPGAAGDLRAVRVEIDPIEARRLNDLASMVFKAV